ncbi:hypothetical protein, partial [Salmonella sp. s51228]|uniref:hypothetical protein n=1 Tax=Salmonella sp. s51228 TaxID=3159652 RepID=UPI00397EB498
NGTTLDFITLTSLNGMPATITMYQNTTFGSTTIKEYDPTTPEPFRFNLPEACKKNTIALNKRYKKDYPEPFQYPFPGMHNFFPF